MPSRARVSMMVQDAVFTAFTQADWLTQFWLSSASGPLTVGETVRWEFMVPGAVAETTASILDPGKQITWDWSDGSHVDIDIEPFEGGCAVTIVNNSFVGSRDEQIEVALNATEGFSIVLCDLKTLLENGKSAGLTSAKARLIQACA